VPWRERGANAMTFSHYTPQPQRDTSSMWRPSTLGYMRPYPGSSV
jgi:hypothetical protein